MPRLLLLLSGLFCCLPLWPQTGKIDTADIDRLNDLAKLSLEKKLQNGHAYALQAYKFSKSLHYVKGFAYACSHLANSLINDRNIDSALLVLNEGIAVSNDKVYRVVNSQLLNRKGVSLYYQGFTDSAVIYLNRSLLQLEALKDTTESIKVISNIGAICLRKGDYDKALLYFYKSLSYNEKQKNRQEIARDYDNIANVLTGKFDYKNAQIYLDRALKIKLDLKDTAGLLKTYLNTGNLYSVKKNYGAALIQFQEGLRMADTVRHLYDYALLINNMGLCYSNLGDYKNALTCLTRSLRYKIQLGNRDGLASTFGNIGKIYLDKKNYVVAVKYYLLSDSMASVTSDPEFKKNAQKELANCYINLGERDKAFSALQQLYVLQDSIFNETSSQQMAEIQVRYETEKKEQENKILQQQNAAKTFENAYNNQKLKSQAKTIIILVVILLMAAVVLAWQLSLARIKKQKRFLETQQKLHQDRERISHDLHDNVGGQLSYILFSLEAAEDASPEKRKEKSVTLSQSVRTIIANLRETIWALNNDQLSITRLSDKLKVYARNIYSFSEVKLTFEEIIEDDEELSPVLALNIYRIGQEIINNAYKHSKATQLLITIVKKERLTLRVTDNGIGFTAGPINEHSFGSEILRRRAKEINAVLDVKSELYRGTTVTLIV